ncbi:MAG: helix-turn-helix domain-containing protein [Actinobacteria bacterium]|nr:helix-turn-helix domain-containing protein [Actinomycetota bacterium]
MSWLLSPDPVAEQLGVQVKTVYVLIHERGLPAFRLGRNLRVKEQDMEQWLDGQRVQQLDESIFTPVPRSTPNGAKRRRLGKEKN